ncbi:MAG: hypothetical protein JWP97_5542 [Labilithrix sp.]|nr:hypothetical protein [Labilithrix sp.]
MFGSKGSDDAFFEAFVAHADTSVAAARLLEQMLALLPTQGAPESYRAASAPSTPALSDLGRQVKEAESKGDRITHDTIKRLRENWITPLDRNDIHTLVSRLDDVLDHLEAASDRLVIFELKSAPPEAAELAKLLVRGCETLGKAVALLRSMKNAPQILEHCVVANQIENAADTLHRNAIAEMYRPGSDPLVVMKWRDIFDSLESAADAIEDVANVIEGVVLEYA